MAIARYSFLPWLRRGIANQMQAAASTSPRAELDAVLTIETRKAKAGSENQLTGTATQRVRIIGPGDVIGINKQMVVRTEPRNWITDFEPNYLAFIEFYDEDFPWRYTPEPPTGHKLRPWLALMVLKESEFERVLTPGRPLASIKFKGGVNATGFMPTADKTWAWAHVHVNDLVNNAPLTDHDFSDADRSTLETVLRNNPDKGISRLVSPRHLEPKTAYYAFVVPAFEVGRKAGLGIEVADNEPGTASSWANAQQEFPIYYEWYFSTSEAGDFETLVRRLVPRDMDPRVGIRDMDVQQPGFGVNDVHTQFTDTVKGITHPLDVVGLEGALKAPTTRSVPLSDDSDFEEKVEPVINLQFELSEEGGTAPVDDPTIAPPLYGQWHAMAKRLSIAASDASWVNDLNKDPRWRTVGGMGTAVVQKNQEGFMRKAWQQIGDVLELNRKIQYTQLAVWVTQMVYDKHLKANVPERIFQITAPVHAKVKGSPYTIKYYAKNSRLTPAVTSGSFRKITRPNSLTAKRLMPDGDRGNLVAQLIQQWNEGKITPAPPLVLPKETPTLGTVVDGLTPTPQPPSPPQPELSFLARFALWLLIAFLLILYGLIWFFNSIILGIILFLVGCVAIWFYAKFLKSLPAPVPVPPGPTPPGPTPPGQPTPEQAKELEKVAENFTPEKMTPEVVKDIPIRKTFELEPSGVEPPSTSTPVPTNPDGTPVDPAAESPVAKEFKEAVEEFHGEIQVVAPPLPPRPALDFDNAYSKVMTAISPGVAIPKRVVPQLVVGTFSYPDYVRKYHDHASFLPLGPPADLPVPPPVFEVERIVEVMAYPHFKQPMYEALRDISTEFFVPNLNLIPPNTLSLMVTNQPFIESYMVGLNHEFSRELLWREYPTDQRGSYFRQFWDVDGFINKDNLPPAILEEKLKDIPEIHRWGSRSQLGAHNHREAGGDKEQLVLVIRGDLLKRYPNTIVYAMRAKWDTDPDHLNNLVLFDETGENLALNNPNILYPLYKAEVKPDITFLGFDLTIQEAKGADNLAETAEARLSIPPNQLGWFFVIKEVPGEPRFGLDEELATNPSDFKWDNMSWKNLGDVVPLIDAGGAFTTNPPGTNPHNINWNSNSADFAYILYQKPVLVGVHAKEMLKNLNQ